jgi:hypothetical protein
MTLPIEKKKGYRYTNSAERKPTNKSKELSKVWDKGRALNTKKTM